MLPRATRRLTPRTATKPAKSLARSSVSRTVSLPTTVPHAGHFRRLWPGRKGDKKAGLLRRFDCRGPRLGRVRPAEIGHLGQSYLGGHLRSAELSHLGKLSIHPVKTL